ncbi:MAG TPA: hypothetical protein VFR11_22060 [Micromonosporaceae bacterium]|nr:hypothetical protein [Micromonosporaceae bacterium]
MPAILFAILLGVAGCTGSHAASRTAAPHTGPVPAAKPTSAAPTANPATDAPCQFKLHIDALPTWARQGFGPPFNGFPYVLSSGGDIVGVLFGTLVAPPPSGDEGANKVVWVAKDPSAGELTVDAHLVGTAQKAEIGDISFGPSHDDVPTPGCWRLTLHWLGPTETVDVVYVSQR